MTLSDQSDQPLKDGSCQLLVGMQEMRTLMYCFHLGNKSEIKYVYIL